MNSKTTIPLAVRIAEVIAWLHVTLFAVFLLEGVHLGYTGKGGGVGGAVVAALFGLPLFSLPVGMVVALRNRKRVLCLCLHAFVVFPVALILGGLFEFGVGFAGDFDWIVVTIWLFVMLASSFALLVSPEASHWFHQDHLERS